MRLVIEDDGGTRTVVPFTSDELTLGRASEGVAFRMAQRNVSRRHARFTRASGSVHVEDLGSLTGTWLNGERISGRRRVRPGDLVEIGDYDLVVASESAQPAGPDAPPPLPETVGAVGPQASGVATTPALVEARSRRLQRAVVLGTAALAAGLVAGLLLGRMTR
jgi:pSer/pThr/pTyr-binding forkhead associated (FHA) protein